MKLVPFYLETIAHLSVINISQAYICSWLNLTHNQEKKKKIKVPKVQTVAHNTLHFTTNAIK